MKKIVKTKIKIQKKKQKGKIVKLKNIYTYYKTKWKNSKNEKGEKKN